MTNQDIAHIFRETALFLEMEGIPWKPTAYEKAAEAIAELNKEIADHYRENGAKALRKIPGVGAAIAQHIVSILKTGTFPEYRALKRKYPIDVLSITAVEGLGAKHAAALYRKLRVKNLQDLENAARAGKIRALPGFGKKSEENILKGIEFLKKSEGRFVLGFVIPQVLEIETRLRNVPGVKTITTAGSVRRRKETVRDIDILVVSENPEPVMEVFTSMPGITRIFARGRTKSSVKLKNGIDVDLRVVPEESYGAALAYFTGGKEHNVVLREIAMRKGFKLNEYGLFKIRRGDGSSRGKTRKNKMIAGQTEEEIYQKLGLQFIPPEMRENKGEIELAKKHKLPKLIDYGDLKGDLQIQTNWTDGKHSIEEMAHAAIKQKLSYIAVTDHTKRLAMTGGLDEKRIQKQWKEIDYLNSKLNSRLNREHGSKFRILKGTECDVLKDGSLDLPDDILSKLDVVGIAVHSHFNLPRNQQTERIIRAMKNPYVNILFHPTGRIINKREAMDVDIDAIIAAAKKYNVILEIDAYPDRLDLKDDYIRKAVNAGVKLAIDSDAHDRAHISFLEYGIAQARRGWAKKSDIINTLPLETLLRTLQKTKSF